VWFWLRDHYQIDLSPGLDGNILGALWLPFVWGVAHVSHSFNFFPYRIAVSILAFFIVLNLSVITYSLQDQFSSTRIVVMVALLWGLGGVAFWLLSRALRSPPRNMAAAVRNRHEGANE
jgi:hypothetical protein